MSPSAPPKREVVLSLDFRPQEGDATGPLNKVGMCPMQFRTQALVPNSHLRKL